MRKPEKLRSLRWFGPDTLRGFGHRSRLKQLRYRRKDFTGRPVIAIVNTWSEINPCHLHLRERAESVKRGVWQAGGFPVEIPAFSITEMYMKASPMLYRNLLAMDTEEALRSLPVDGAVLMGGCDKTTPGLLMGANQRGSSGDLSARWPDAARQLERPAARQRNGFVEILDGAGRGADHGRGLERHREWHRALAGFLHDDGDRVHHDCGTRIVEMVWEDRKPSGILKRGSFENAITVDMAIGGSTNAMIHLVAMAGRCGLQLELPLFDKISRRVPVLADIRPSGRFLMEDFYYAGGLGALMGEIRDLFHLDCATVNGKTLGENLAEARIHNPEVIRTRGNPLFSSGGTTVLYGSLAPDGAVVKTSAADSRLLKHTGPAVVFQDYNDSGGAHQQRRSQCHRGLGARVAERGAAGRSGNA
jgi:dihydroxyacid dehydratase/phosphogluconate dehydratase